MADMRYQDMQRLIDQHKYHLSGGLPDLGRPHSKSGYRYAIGYIKANDGSRAPARFNLGKDKLRAQYLARALCELWYVLSTSNNPRNPNPTLPANALALARMTADDQQGYLHREADRINREIKTYAPGYSVAVVCDDRSIKHWRKALTPVNTSHTIELLDVEVVEKTKRKYKLSEVRQLWSACKTDRQRLFMSLALIDVSKPQPVPSNRTRHTFHLLRLLRARVVNPCQFSTSLRNNPIRTCNIVASESVDSRLVSIHYLHFKELPSPTSNLSSPGSR